ncbi:MAG: hypothetical protein J0M01_07680 [Dechloromonas sp.]|jgi:hypothetical protein|nr:hypothetical protein [Dechloromonas sp.]
MGFNGTRDLILANQDGRTHFCSFRKAPSQASSALGWVDLSMAAGNPLPQYYAAAPLEAARLDGLRGIFHGADKAPATMHLTDWHVMTPTANCVGRLKALRYGLYYPFIDGDSLDQQDLVNGVAAQNPPPGGWKVMIVAVAPTAGGGSLTFNYLRGGVEKTSPAIALSSAVVNIASIATGNAAVANSGMPFARLSGGDTGVDAIVSVTFVAPAGGLLAFVLVDPLADIATREINTPAEKNFVQAHPGAPRIFDGDYINFIGQCAGTVAAGIFAGFCNFAWSK